MKIGFLFNHEALHQISHTAPIIAELARHPGVEITVLTSSAAQAERARSLLGEGAAGVRFVGLGIGRAVALLDAVLGRVAPVRRVAVLRANRAVFATLDVLVVPETTSLLLRDRFGLADLKFVWVPHGAGDRSVGFRDVARGFDLVLLSGGKVRDRMLAGGAIAPDRYAIVGYPKFDVVDPATPLPSLFANGRPTVLYNPHFEPELSSWYDMGEAILDWFAGQDRFNLIFAPHVMLFRRRLHASVEHRRVRWRRGLAARFCDRPQILIDTGSTRSVDMSYTRAADIYLGDVSSQIYEWIARPRPAIFLNPGHVRWAQDPSFAHWRLGRVIKDVADLPAALDEALRDPGRCRDAQRTAFDATFDRGEASASRRAASVIVRKATEWLSERSARPNDSERL